MQDKNETMNHAMAELPAQEVTQEEIDATRRAEEQLNRDPFAGVRPLINAITETILDLAPMFPRQYLKTYITEANAFKFVTELEKRGFRVVEIPRAEPNAIEHNAALNRAMKTR